MVFLAVFADLATIAIAYDQAHVEPRPVEWQLPKSGLSAFCWVSCWLLGPGLSGEHYTYPMVVLSRNLALFKRFCFWRSLLRRTGSSLSQEAGKYGLHGNWSVRFPVYDVIATLFCLFGWLYGTGQVTDPADRAKFRRDGWVDIVTVVVIWAYSIGVIIVIALVYHVLTNMPWLDNLGRKSRSKSDTKIENVLGHLSKLALEHETERDDRDVYRLTNYTAIEEGEE